MRILLLLTTLLLNAGPTFADSTYQYETSDYYSLRYDTFRAGKGLRFQSLKSLIEEKKLTTMPALLEELKKREPEVFDQYLLAYRSRSLQESSSLYPRVIIAADQGKFMMAFNGHPDDEGYNHLEIIEFKEKERRFELREITFGDGGALPKFSQANPAKCLSCHQSPTRTNVDPRPNWEPYNTWPGFYSSRSKLDAHDTSLKNDLRLREEDQVLVYEAIHERENLERFENEVKPAHPRYKHLGKFDEKRTVEITDNLGHLNYQRIVRILSETKEFETYKPAFFSALKCGNFNWPEEVDRRHAQSPYVETKRINTISINMGRHGKEWLEYSSKRHPTHDFTIAQILTVIFEPLGISTEDWSMDFRTERARFAFAERFGIPSFPRKKFDMFAKSEWPEYDQMDCDELRERAQSQDYNLQAIIPMISEDQFRSKVINRCLSCHSSMDSIWSLAPELPFHSPADLFKAIEKRGYSKEEFYKKVEHYTGAHATLKEQMPPRQSLSAQERAALLKYLKDVLH